MRRFGIIISRTVGLTLSIFFTANSLYANPTLIGTGEISGTAIDQSGLTDTLSDGTPHNRLGGIGSGIAYTGQGDQYVMVPDRGPADGTTSYIDRMETLTIHVDPTAGTVSPSLNKTTLLTNGSGQFFTGSAAAFDATTPANSLRLDPEGIRVGPTGQIYISDEYGPYVYQFNQNGQRVGTVAVPSKFGIDHPNADGTLELPPNNLTGRQSNRGMEGLAITPSGSKLYGIMQSPLIQDGGLNAANARVGLNTRILEMTPGSTATREFLYPLANANNGISEILAVNNSQFLVLERDGRAGSTAQFKQIFLVNLLGATDISNIGTTPFNGLPTSGIPSGVTPVSKTLFLDLLNPIYGLAGASFPEKIEGLAFGPDLPDGRHLLLVATDNDFAATNPTRFFAFALDQSDLPGFQAQQIVPEPATFALMLIGVTLLAFWRCRFNRHDGNR